jgi:hypothetical protein
VLRATSAFARHKDHDFNKITTQLATDIKSSKIATVLLMASPWRMN